METTCRCVEKPLSAAAPRLMVKLELKKGKAVGSDLLDGYLLRIATEDIQKDYWRLLVEIVETKAYPREWNDWIAMLAIGAWSPVHARARRADRVAR